MSEATSRGGSAGGAGRAELTFIGTATTLLRLGPFTVLTDPNFLHRGQWAYLGKGLVSRRVTEPALGVDELPPLDAVVLSHLHGDHFDRVSKAGLSRDAPVVTTRHAARRLKPWGFRTVGLDTWQEHVLEQGSHRLSVESLPGVHAYGALAKALPPVMGSLLRWSEGGDVRRTLYLTGDTLTGPHLQEIRQRHPGIDGAVVHLGGTRVLGAIVTLDGRGGLELLEAVNPGYAVPVHYDDYTRFLSPLSDFLAAVRGTGFDARVRVVQRGQTISLF
jgi:L-ascorbate metabolism protein UlaG (beta-lactamase superfamily)